MSNTKWTENQLLAINEKGTDLLVSAAAGSGKTAVLTERIIKQLTDTESPVNVTDFLIVTFTVSATSELREKLSKAIRETYSNNRSLKRLKRQILTLPSAKILTIDSFCKYIVSECANSLGIPGDFRTGEESELDQLTSEVLSDTVEAYFEGYEGEKLYDTSYLPTETRSGFLSVVEAFTTQKSLEGLNDAILDIYKKITKYPEPISKAKEYLKEYDTILRKKYESGLDISFFDTSIGKYLSNEIKETAKVAAGYFESAEKLLEGYDDMSLKYGTVIHDDIISAVSIYLADDPDTLSCLCNFKPSSLSPYRSKNDNEKDIQERFKKLRDTGKEILNNLKKKYPITDENMMFMQIADTFSIANELFSIVIDFHKKLTEAKYDKKMFSFDDIAQLAYKALIKEGTYNHNTREFERTDYALELGEKFHEILIDEYQDVNELQDTIFRAVSNTHNRFMVGDLKQSIYKFRGATPEIFFEYRNSFSPITSTDGSPRLVALQNNFRSDKSVIDFVNTLFSVIMNYSNDSVYRPDDYLTYTPIDGRTDKQIPTEITIIGNDAEFDYVADTIMNTVNSGEEYKFSDICILARKHDSLKLIQKILSERNIPTDYTPNENFFGSFEIQTIHNLLKAIDNPTDDVALLSAMTSPVFAFSPSELVKIRNHTSSGDMYFAARDYNGNDKYLKDKCFNLITKLKFWRKKAGTVQSDSFIWWIYNQTHLLSSVKKLNDGDTRKENLLTFYNIACKFEEREFRGLTGFLVYLDSLVNSKNRFGKKETAANAVRLMTIHDSKGLEFPICFYISAGSQISRADEKKKIVMSETFGPTFSVPIGKLGGKIVTYAEKAAVAETRSGAIDEELRLLYVALTRAKNRLIITGHADIEKFKDYIELANMSRSTFSYSVKNSLTMLRVIGAGLYTNGVFAKAFEEFSGESITSSAELLTVNLHPEYQTTCEVYETIDAEENKADSTLAPEDVEYALTHAGNAVMSETPYKISVSSLREGLLDEGTPATVKSVKKYPDFMSLDTDNLPSFIGTAMHVFMQFCDFDNCVKNGTVAEADRLLKKGFITEKQNKVLNHIKLTEFFKSKTYNDICLSSRVEREKRYTLLVPSSRFYTNEEKKQQLDALENKTLIQGVIDCYYINSDNEIVLIDFKTDIVSPKNGEKVLKERHSKQMELYKEAVAEIEGKEVCKAIIYSFDLSKEIEI